MRVRFTSFVLADARPPQSPSPPPAASAPPSSSQASLALPISALPTATSVPADVTSDGQQSLGLQSPSAARKRQRSPADAGETGRSDKIMRFSQSPHSSMSDSIRSPSPKRFRSMAHNGDSRTKSDGNGVYVNGQAAANGASLAVNPSFYGHDREELSRILIQGLVDLGYHASAKTLAKESGFQVEGPHIAAFREAVLNANWREAERLLFGTHSEPPSANSQAAHASLTPSSSGSLPLVDGANPQQMKSWIRKQKFLELLEAGQELEALHVLRKEILPLGQSRQEIARLSDLLMVKDVDSLKEQAEWDGAKGHSRHKLLALLSQSIERTVLVPEHRLATLLDDVKRAYIQGCPFHNTRVAPSLLVPHQCDGLNFPKKLFLSLGSHHKEVWFLKYSHDGTKLASVGEDGNLILFDTTKKYRRITRVKKHANGVVYLDWSPDDSKLITCSNHPEGKAVLWNATGHAIMEYNMFTYACTSAAFTPDGKHVIIGSQDDQHGLGLYDFAGNCLYNWSEPRLRVNALAVSPDGHRLVALLARRILVYDLDSRQKINEYTISGITNFTSVSSSRDSKYMLVSAFGNEGGAIKLMHIDTGTVLQTYEGHKHSRDVIRSAFGGADENFVISGSENSKVYIWRTSGKLIAVYEGHNGGCVNAAAWHPKHPSVFATAGDDKTVKIWTPDGTLPQDLPQVVSNCNGFSK